MAGKEKTREFTVNAHPYADVSGTIQVPESLTDEDEIHAYVSEHWDEIKFGEPDLDYAGTDFEVYDD